MTEIITPDQVIAELNRLMQESSKGVEALFAAEVKVANLEADYDRALAVAQLETQGTALDRTATAKLKCVELNLALNLARAEMNRIKMKMRTIDSAQVAVSVIAKQVEATMRHS
jgi:hypothetical protein